MYEYIKEYYLMGLYTNADLDIFVTAGMLTEDDIKEATNKKNQALIADVPVEDTPASEVTTTTTTEASAE